MTSSAIRNSTSNPYDGQLRHVSYNEGVLETDRPWAMYIVGIHYKLSKQDKDMVHNA